MIVCAAALLRLCRYCTAAVGLPFIEFDLILSVGLSLASVDGLMQVSYMAQRSVADSLTVEAGENAWVLVVSYLCMFLYVSLILGSPCDAIR